MKLRKGQIVAVEFLDHVADASSPLKFTLYGRLAKITRTALICDSWCYADKGQSYDHNVNRHTIVRAAITNVSILREVKD